MDQISVISTAGVAVFGAVIGSFLNALSFRFNTGRSMRGRSRCMHCGAQILARDLVPVISFLILRGRCRFCRAKLSLQYPLVELAAAAFAVLVYLESPNPFAFAFFFLFWATLLFTVVYDLRHTIIPWSCSGLLVALALISLALGHHTNLSAVAAGPLLALPLFLISLVSGGRWMGWGDSALEASLGWLLGLAAGASALALAFWSGAFIGVVLLVYAKLPWRSRGAGFTMNSEIPFAPFLALGALVAHFFHVDFFSTLSLFWQ